MPSSFLAGARKVFNDQEPRFVVLTGNEYGLRTILLSHIVARDAVELSSVDAASELLHAHVATQAFREGATKVVRITHPDSCESWDWLPIWFNKAKGIRIVVDGAGKTLATNLERVCNTRGIVIDCSAPTGDAGRARTLKMLSAKYGQSITQMNLLLNKHDWDITACMQLLDKLALLNLPLTSDTLTRLGVVRNHQEEFVRALMEDDKAAALLTIGYLNTDDYASIVQRLSGWLDKMSRVKCAIAFMKGMHELAFEVGETAKDTEVLLKQGRRYDLNRINRISLALAAADREIARGNTNGVLEVMVDKW